MKHAAELPSLSPKNQTLNVPSGSKAGFLARTGVAPKDPYNGFTLVEIMIVVAIIGLLAAIAIPNYIRSRITSQKNACINNLRQIDAAKQQWAFEFHAALTATPTIADIQPYLGRGVNGTQPTCPSDSAVTFPTSYAINEIQSIPTCLIVPSTHELELNAATVVTTPTGHGGDGGGDGNGDGNGGGGH